MTMTPAARTTSRVLAVVVLVLVLLVWLRRDDDRPVDPERPDAQRAIAAAQAVLPGRLVDVRRDADNGKWEVTLHAEGADYEVELAPRDLSLLRIDYD
jgi:heme A synthase